MNGPGWAEVSVPASSGNLGSGFDAIGLAIELRDTFRFEHSHRDYIEADGKFAKFVPVDVRRNLSFRAFRSLAPQSAGRYRLHVHRVTPGQGGLGSSACAIVGGLVAAKLAFNLDISSDELLERAADLEGHPDNVGPALVGGLVITVRDGSDLHWLPVKFPDSLGIVLIVPAYRVATARARVVLPQQVPLADAVANLSRTALLIGALQAGRFDQLRVATTDQLHEPYRSKLNPALDPCRESAAAAGAYATVLSGSGPTIIALCPPERNLTIASAMGEACTDSGHKCETYVIGAASSGAQPTENWIKQTRKSDL